MDTTDFEAAIKEQNKTDRNLLLQKFEELQQQHLRNSTTPSQSNPSPNDATDNETNNEEFEDIQFFHRLPQLQPIKMNINGSDVVRGALYDYSNNTSENPFVFPDNVMEYGEPQFFPGICVGYLETILEETDEEYEEEEGCSGRHWWTADSDTDTESVIRVDRVSSSLPCAINEVSLSQIPSVDTLNNLPPEDTSPSINNSAPFSAAPFRTTASSKPFEMEDLYLFDQLDLAFEETLTKPRGRSGFAFRQENQQELLQDLEQRIDSSKIKPDLGPVPPNQNGTKVSKPGESASSSSDDEQPAEVNEEDFFYSTSEENSSMTTTSESDDTSSDEGGNKDGVVLAEFSLQSNFNGGLFKSHRRSFEGPPSKSALRSFRSFDSLNSLAGTELLFSNADTFPSFHEILKEAEVPSATTTPPGEEDSDGTRIPDKSEVTRKSSGEMSSENLSEDSGIGDGAMLERPRPPPPPQNNFIAKSAFALNPHLVYSSASEESSMVSVGSNQSFESQPLNCQNSCETNSSNSSDSTPDNPPEIRSGNAKSPPPMSEFLSNPNTTTTNPFTVPLSSFSRPHPSYLEQTSEGHSSSGADKNLQTPAKTNLVEENSFRPFPTISSPLPATNESLDTYQNYFSDNFTPNTFQLQSSSNVGGGYTLEDEEEDESNEMFKMLELEAQGYDFAASSHSDAAVAYNNFCKLNSIPRANSSFLPEPEVIRMTSSDDVSHEPQTNSLRESMNTNEMSESDCLLVGAHNTTTMLQDAPTQELLGVGIKSGPMSTLGVEEDDYNDYTVPAHSPPPNQDNVLEEKHFISPLVEHTARVHQAVLSMNYNPSSPHISSGSSNGNSGVDMEYFESLESEILALEEENSASGVCLPVQPQVSKEQLRSAKSSKEQHQEQGTSSASKTSQDSTTLVSEGKEEERLEHLLRLLDPTPSSSSSSTPSISGPSKFGGAGGKEAASSFCYEGLQPVSEPLVVRKRAWTCAENEEEEDFEGEGGNVPDILKKIQKSTGTTTTDMEVVERPRSISPRGVQQLQQQEQQQRQTPSPIPIKTYGTRGEVEVFLVSSRTPSPISPNIKVPGQEQHTTTAGGSGTGTMESQTGSLKANKTVHFSPVVSEISWRESYTDQGSEFSESSNSDHHLDHYFYGGSSGGNDEEDDEDEEEDTLNEDEMMNTVANSKPSAVIERVQVQSQVIQEPTTINSNQSHPSGDESGGGGKAGPLLSNVPDLLTQCENVSNLQQQEDGQPRGHRGVDIKFIDNEKHPSDSIDFIEIQPQEQQQQQQIFPTVFADTKDKSGKPAKKKGFSIGKSKDKEKDKEKDKKNKEKEVKDTTTTTTITMNEEKQEKPSFFQRLSKIRLSGSSGNKSKTKAKIHPKEKENEEPMTIEEMKPIIVSSAGTGDLAPILKKSNGTTTTPTTTTTTNVTTPGKNGHISNPPHEGEECSAAFESILEEIAGLNTIRQRQARTPTSSGKRSFAERNQFLSNPEIDRSPDDALESKLSQFKADASKTRDEIAKSHPDLDTMEDVTRIKSKSTSSPTLSSEDSRQTPTSSPGKKSSKNNSLDQSGNTIKQEREWYKLLKSASEKYFYGGKVSKSQPASVSSTSPSADAVDQSPADKYQVRSTGIVETDLDTGASREMLDAELIELDFEKSKVPPPRPPLPKSPTSGNNGKARSLTNLTSGGLKFSLPPEPSSPLLYQNGIVDIDTLANEVEERAKSFEFLLDETQKCSSVPPENQLRQEARQLSEHELRIQRSLQKLNIPDWYRKHGGEARDRSADSQSSTTSSTTSALKLLKRAEYGSASGLAGGWAGLSACRTPSLSSLQNSGRYAGSLTRSNFVRGRPATMSAMNRSSRESLLSPSSTASQSPNAFERCSFTYGMPYSLARFGHGRLSSTSGASPANSSPPSTPGPLSTAYTKKPYLGWRSQERLNTAPSAATPPKLSFYRPPAERLAAEVMTLRQKSASLRPSGSDRPPLPKPPPRAEKTSLTRRDNESECSGSSLPTPPSVHDSIREVTDAINQFVSLGQDEPPRPRPRQKSGKKQQVWMESSFVGRKPRVSN